MKFTISQIRTAIREALAEAAKEGQVQKTYKRSFKRGVATAAKGGNKNTPPYTKAPKVGKSGPVGMP